MDGWITIGTKIDTKGLKNDYKKLEEELRRKEKENEILIQQKKETEQSISETEFTKEFIKQEYNDLVKKMDTQEKINNLRTEEANILKLFDAGLEEYKNDLVIINQKIEDNVQSQEKLKKEIEDTTKNAQKQARIESIDKGIKNINSSVKRVTHSIRSWIIGLISVRALYISIRKAMNYMLTNNEQLKADLEYIKFVAMQGFVNVLESIGLTVERIIELLKELLYYLGYIIRTWFGIDIFKNTGIEDFNKHLKQSSKYAKDLNKQFASFDEMEVLQDTSGGSGIKSPSFNLSKDADINKPQWLIWLGKKKKELLALFAGIAGFVTAIKLGLSGLKALGIAGFITGIVYAIENLVDYLKDPSWENFGGFIQGIGVAIVGIGVAIGNIPVIITGAIVLIYGTILKYWDKIYQFLNNDVYGYLVKLSNAITLVFGQGAGDIFKGFVNVFKSNIDLFDDLFTRIKDNFNELISFIKNVFTGNWKGAFENVINIAKNIWTGWFNIIVTGFSNILSVASGVVNGIKDWWGGLPNWLKTIMESAFQAIIGPFNLLGNTLKTIFTNAWNAVLGIFKNNGSAFINIKEGIASVFKQIVNHLIDGINNVISKPFDTINNMIWRLKEFSVFGNKPFNGLSYVNLPKIPHLAKGTILNNPGKGVPVVNAIAGEAGREAYLPLSDTQLLEELGQTIGKYITINANITNTMNGRVISRELKQVQNDLDFAYNR